ncbi:conserved Plasmodium protein, unknown function [Plasmodium sp. DRC-Itaito]|nr:conserved Plasmodium protein, unknown function [Plasmodium sp. DRC-Itaito]
MITNTYKKHKKLCLSMHYNKGPVSSRRHNNYYGYNKYKNYYNYYKLYNYNKMTNDEYEEIQDVENMGGGIGIRGSGYRNVSSLNDTYCKGKPTYKYVDQKDCKNLLRGKKKNHTSDDSSIINNKNGNEKKKIIKILKRPTEEEMKKEKKINSKEQKNYDNKKDEKSNSAKDENNVESKQSKEEEEVEEVEVHCERYLGRDYVEGDKKKEQQKKKKKKEKKKEGSQDIEEKEDKQKKERKEKKLKKKAKEEKSKKDNKTIAKTKKSKDQFKFSSTQELFNLLLKDVKKEEDFLEAINEPEEKDEKKKQKKEGVEASIKEKRNVIDKISSKIGKLNNKYEANKTVGEVRKKDDVNVISKENERMIKNKSITPNGSNNNNNNNNNNNKNNNNCDDEVVGRTSTDVYHKGCISHLNNNHLNSSGNSTYLNHVDNKESVDKIYVDAMINYHNNMNVNNYSHMMNMTCNNNNNNNNRSSGNNNDVMKNGKKDAMWKEYVHLKNKRSKHKNYNTTHNNNHNNSSNMEKMNMNNMNTNLNNNNNKKQTSKIMKNLEKKCHSKFATVLLGGKKLEQKHDEIGRVVQNEEEDEEARKINMRIGNVNYMMKYGPSDKIILNGMNESKKNDNIDMSDNVNLSVNNMNNVSPRTKPGSVSGAVPGMVSPPNVINYNSKADVSNNNKTINIKKEEEAGQFVIPLYMRSPKPEQIPIPLYFSEGENMILPKEDLSLDEKKLMKVAVNNEMNDNMMGYSNGTICNNNNMNNINMNNINMNNNNMNNINMNNMNNNSMNNMVTMNPLSSFSYNLNDTNNNLLNDPLNNHVRMFKEKLANAQYVKTKNYTRNLKEYLYMNMPKDKNPLNYSKKKKKTFLNRNYVTFNAEVNNHGKMMGVNHDMAKSADRNNMKSVNGSIYNNNMNNMNNVNNVNNVNNINHSSSNNNNISNGMHSFHMMKASYYNGCNLNKGGRYFKVDKYFYSRKYKVRTHYGDNNGHHKYRHFQFLKDIKIAVY